VSAFGRTFLRLAACQALRDKTLVGDKVFDSRIAALDPETFLPNIGDIAGSIGVYTEQDAGAALAEQNGGPPFRPEIDLVLEIAMQAKFKVGDAFVVETPTTDDELEVTLDVIEGQAEMALFPPAYSAAVEDAASYAFSLLTKRVESKTSIRFTNPASGDKTAIRYVTYKIEIADPSLPIYERNFVDNDAQPLRRLPEVWQEVVALWPSDSIETEKATLIAQMLAPPTKTLLEGVDAEMSPGNNPPNTTTYPWAIEQ
jgi:hypothetical protein